MPNSPSSSFIPKQGSAKRSRQVVSRQLHLFTVLSYVLFFASLTASVGVFLYDKHVNNQLENEVVNLNGAISSFSTEKMTQVRAFNDRLNFAKDRIDNSVSAASVFESLESATAQSVVIESLSMKRIEDTRFELTAELNTESFDSTLFQRGLYERNPIVETVEVTDLSIGKPGEEDALSGVSFKAELGIPLDSVPYVPVSAAIPLNIGVDMATTTQASSTESLSAGDNQTTL